MYGSSEEKRSVPAVTCQKRSKKGQKKVKKNLQKMEPDRFYHRLIFEMLIYSRFNGKK